MTTSRHAPPATRLPSMTALVLITLVFYAGIVGLATRHYHFNLSALLSVGDQAEPASRAQLLGHNIVVFRHSRGFDGQLYYYVADDPVPLTRQTAFRNPFYYQRVLYPLATAVLSLGKRDARPLTMLLINIICTIACAALAWLLATDYIARGEGAAPNGAPGESSHATARPGIGWWIALAAINPSLILAVQLDLPEPLAYALAFGGLLSWRRGRSGPAAMCFALALLARESTAMLLVPIVIVTAWRRRALDTLVLSAAVVPYLAWRAALGHVFEHPGATTTTWASDFGKPFGGIASAVGSGLQALERHQFRAFAVHQATIVAVVVIVLGAAALGLWQMWRGGDGVTAGTFLAAAAVAVVGSGGIWDAYSNAGRDFGLVFPMLAFSLATRVRYRWLALLLCALTALLTALTVYRAVGVTPGVAYTVTR